MRHGTRAAGAVVRLVPHDMGEVLVVKVALGLEILHPLLHPHSASMPRQARTPAATCDLVIRVLGEY